MSLWLPSPFVLAITLAPRVLLGRLQTTTMLQAAPAFGPFVAGGLAVGTSDAFGQLERRIGSYSLKDLFATVYRGPHPLLSLRSPRFFFSEGDSVPTRIQLCTVAGYVYPGDNECIWTDARGILKILLFQSAP